MFDELTHEIKARIIRSFFFLVKKQLNRSWPQVFSSPQTFKLSTSTALCLKIQHSYMCIPASLFRILVCFVYYGLSSWKVMLDELEAIIDGGVI